MTQHCSNCRFWSEMLAHSNGGPVEAVCLETESPNSGKFVPGSYYCHRWKSDALGSIDSPAFLRSDDDPAAIYAEYDDREEI